MLRRLVDIPIFLLALSAVLFALLCQLPGDPIDRFGEIGVVFSPVEKERIQKLEGLDLPWYRRYIRWIWGYYDIQHPPYVAKIPDQYVMIGSSGVADVAIDLEKYIDDVDAPVDPAVYWQELQKIDADLATEMQSEYQDVLQSISSDFAGNPSVRNFMLLDQAVEKRALGTASRLRTGLRRAQRTTLQLQPLHGANLQANTQGQPFLLVQQFQEPGVHAIWCKVRDADGLENLAAATVFVSPPVDNRWREEDVMAGNGESEDATPPTVLPQEIAVWAREGARHPFIVPIPAQNLQAPSVGTSTEAGILTIALDKLIERPELSSVNKIQFQLTTESMGSIDENRVYQHQFTQDGQSVVAFTASTGEKDLQGAFVVQHGERSNPNNFIRGAVFALVGDSSALGYSKHWQRSIYELLFGKVAVCGDGQMDGAEQCDDRNRYNQDGCNSLCQKELKNGVVTDETARSAVGNWFAQKVRQMLRSEGRAWMTLQLVIPTLCLSTTLSWILAIFWVQTQKNKYLNSVIKTVSNVGVSLPVFVVAVLAVRIFAIDLHWFPTAGSGNTDATAAVDELILARLQAMALPVTTLSFIYTCRWLRYLEPRVNAIANSAWADALRARGFSRSDVLWRAGAPILAPTMAQVIALHLPSMLGGALLTETIFAWPGLGRLEYEALLYGDIYLAMVLFLFGAAAVFVANIVADVVQRLLDPRLRAHSEGNL